MERARFIEDTKCVYTGQWREPNLQNKKAIDYATHSGSEIKSGQKVEEELENLIV